MKKILQRVDKDYWFLAAIWLLSVAGNEITWLTVLTGAVIAGYLTYKMLGEK
jgi:hypothetical protein